jgi:cytidine deaminase
VKLSSLLPQAFGPRDLGFKEGAFPVRETALILPKGLSDELAPAAFEAAGKSYAPYSKAYSGIAIGSRSGRIYKGAYIENAAFNPSLSPLQTALVSWIVAGESDSEISKVTLVELQGASISQKSATEAVLSAISSTVKLHVVSASMKAS